MTGAAKALRYTAFTLMVLFGLLGGLFVAGYTFEDPGGWNAVLRTAGWVLPLLALAVYALVRKEAAGPVFVAVTVFVGLGSVLDSLVTVVPREDWGPVLSVGVFSVGVALAFLGLFHARLAGLLMVALALTQLLATALVHIVHGDLFSDEGPGLTALLGGSSGVVVLPLLVVGVLFLMSDSLGREPRKRTRQPHVRPAH